MGWNVIVKKEEFKAGDLCVFFEIDSVLPEDVEWAQFMQSKKFRVKTMKMRGVLSQGLALPISILPDDINVEIGKDVTEILNVKKHNPDEYRCKLGDSEGSFPFRVPKTDELRIQSSLHMLEEIIKQPFYISVKCDGSSGTFGYDEDGFYAASRNWKKKRGENVFWAVAEKYSLEEKLKDKQHLVIQGEVVGPGIQKNKMELDQVELRVFNVFDQKERFYCDYHDLISICEELNLPTVPIEMVVTDLENFDNSLEAWLNRAKGFYKNKHREGIVVRPLKETRSRLGGGRLSFKIINNDFLLGEI